jgi:hypothetical protein
LILTDREWQGRWDAADTCRFAHSILPKVSLRPWFEGQRKDRKFVSTVLRIGLLKDRFRIVERFETDKRRLTDALTALDMQLETPVHDVCALKKWRAMKSWN